MIYGRKKQSLESVEEVTLDVNKLVGDNEFFVISGLSYSPNEKLAVYGEEVFGIMAGQFAHRIQLLCALLPAFAAEFRAFQRCSAVQAVIDGDQGI